MPIEAKGLKFLVRALGSRNFRLYFFGQAAWKFMSVLSFPFPVSGVDSEES
jgi:hypothetical protein